MKPSLEQFKGYPAAIAAQIEWINIKELRRNPKNARRHSWKQQRKIAASIRQFGFMNPIIVDEDNMILAGHGRLEAARLEGIVHLPILRFDHLTAAQKRAYVIADNKIAEEAGWDREILAVELSELIELLSAEGLDISISGFETAEVDQLFTDRSFGSPELEDTIPPLQRKAITRLGDLWLCGKHRLLCGDARQAFNFDRLMIGVCAAAVFCDPPYNLRVATIGGRGKVRHGEFAFASGEMTQAEFRAFLAKTLGNAVRVSRKGAVHYVFMDWRHFDDLTAVGRQLFGAMLNLVVWNKSNAGQGSFYRSQHELIGVFRVGEHPHRNNVELGRFGRNRSNVWTYAGANTFGHGRTEALASHPTVKPVSLVADALLDCTARGEVVLDQFAGSGTIILAAERVGRIAHAMEYAPAYVDVAVKRWQSVTKMDATLDGDGRTFEELAQDRAQPMDQPGGHDQRTEKSQSRPQVAPTGTKKAMTRRNGARVSSKSEHGHG